MTLRSSNTHRSLPLQLDDLEATVRRLWDNRLARLANEPEQAEPTTSMVEDSSDKLLVPFPRFEERFSDSRSVQSSPLPSETGDPSLSPHAMAAPPMVPMSPDGKTDITTDKSRSLDDMGSPQSVITTGESGLSPKDSSRSSPLLTRRSSGWNPFANDASAGGSQDSTPRLRRKRRNSMSVSHRSLFGTMPSEEQLLVSRDICADDCISILNEDSSRMKGTEFFEHIRATLLTQNVTSLELPSLSRSPSSASPSVEDRWLLESNYRAAALHREVVWNTCLSLLSRMNKAVKDIELERGMKLNSMLLVALPLERRMFLEAKDVHQSVVDELLRIRHDRQYLSDSIESMIDHHARILRHRDSDHKSSILNRSRQLSIDPTNTSEPLEAEKTYGITHQAMVAERSVGLRSWKTTLVVVTMDLYMHLFDVSFIPDITLGSSATEGFDFLLPNDDFSDYMPIVPRTEKLLKHLRPVSSVDLRNCTVSDVDKGSAEVIEKHVGLFRDKIVRRLTLRCKPHDLASWKHFLARARKVNS